MEAAALVPERARVLARAEAPARVLELVPERALELEPERARAPDSARSWVNRFRNARRQRPAQL